jgi:hypothetical protein
LVPIAASASEIADYALAVFLLAVGLSLAWAFLRLSGTFDRLSSLIRGTERELLPVISKVGVSVDKVNDELDKVGVATDSTVDADEAVRTVSWAVKRPIQKLAGLSAGISHGAASLRARRGWKTAVQTGKDAAARREADLEEELQRIRG